MIDFFSLLALASASAAAPTLQVTPCNAGDHYRFTSVDCRIQISNLGEAPVRLSEIKALRATDHVGVQSIVVGPKSTSYVPVSLQLDLGFGTVNHYFVASSDEPGSPHYQLVARVFANSILDEINPTVNFSTVELGANLPAKSITLSSQEAPNFRVTGIVSAPDYLKVSVGGDGRTVVMQPKENVPWGPHDDLVRIGIESAQQKQESIRVRMDAHGAVVPAQNPVDLGLMRQGQINETKIRLTSRDGKKIRVGKLAVEGFQASVATSSCLPQEDGCALLKVALDAKQPLGEVKGRVLVDLPDYKAKLSVFIWGMLVRPDTEVRSLDQGDIEKAQPQGLLPELGGPQSSQPRVSVRDAISDAVTPHVDLPAPPGTGPLIKWTVANERAIHAYVIYRGDSEAGPFARANAESIPAQNIEGGPSLYQWRDASALPGQTYWYQIGMIYNDGHKQQLTGPQKVVAK